MACSGWNPGIFTSGCKEPLMTIICKLFCVCWMWWFGSMAVLSGSVSSSIDWVEGRRDNKWCLQSLGSFSGVSDGKESAHSTEDPGSTPGLGRYPREGHGNLLQCSCLENSMDRRPWRATVHGVSKSLTRLSNFHSFSVLLLLKLQFLL